MPGHQEYLKLLAGAVLFAAFVFAIVSAPCFLFDLNSSVPGQAQGLEAAR